MSSRYFASGRVIDRLDPAESMLSEDVVRALLDRSARVEIDLSSQDLAEFLLEHEEPETGRPTRLELDHHVHIARRPEIVPQSRTEQLQPLDPVPAAELGDRRLGDSDSCHERLPRVSHGLFL